MGLHVPETCKKQTNRNSKKANSLKIHDMVRISHLKKVFQRSYDQQWSSEIFKTYHRFLKQGIQYYKLKDFLDFKILGNFQTAELQKVFKSADTLWYVEKNLKKRRRKNKIEWLCRFILNIFYCLNTIRLDTSYNDLR